MAQVKYSAIVSEMRGKLNGSVFSKNRAGNYIRNKVTPVNPQSIYQSNQRAKVTQVSQAWRGITQAQRTGWQAASVNFPYTDVFGDAKTLSGQGLFLKLNLNLLKVGAAIISAAPTPAAIGSINTLTLTFVAATGVVTATFTSTGAGASQNILIEFTPAINPGVSFVKNQYRVLTSALLSGSPYVGTAAYLARFGTVSVGQKVFVRISVVNNVTGQASTPVVAMAIAS